MDCKKLYLCIQEQLQSNMNLSLESANISKIASAQSFIDDYNIWVDWVGKKYNNSLFVLALSEYETSIVFCLQALYKQAFTGLRSCLEHTLFGIQLSTNLYQLLQWKDGKCDVYWSNITDENSGLFSKTYVTAFCPEMCGLSSLVGTITKSLYRECSEYVHGNYKIAISNTKQFQYNEDMLLGFFEKLENLRYILEFSLFIRFQSEFVHEDISMFEPQLIEYLGHLQEINDFLSISDKGE